MLSFNKLALFAGVAELADAQDLGSCGRKAVGVQIPPSAPRFHIFLLSQPRFGASNRRGIASDGTPVEFREKHAPRTSRKAGRT